MGASSPLIGYVKKCNSSPKRNVTFLPFSIQPGFFIHTSIKPNKFVGLRGIHVGVIRTGSFFTSNKQRATALVSFRVLRRQKTPEILSECGGVWFLLDEYLLVRPGNWKDWALPHG